MKKFSSKRPTTGSQSSQGKEKFILLFNNPGAATYYKINASFLFLYSIYSISYRSLSDIPDYIKSSITIFGGAALCCLAGLTLFSNRHIKSIILNKSKGVITIETYHMLGFTNSKVYQIALDKEIKYIVPLKNYIMYDYGIYFIILRSNQFRYGNYFIMRPYDIQDKEEFDLCFKNLIMRKKDI